MTSQQLRFVVHEHKARTRHYDFRLEIGGVLKSWAVPKGPSLNPSEKRLAIMVADHTLAYYSYEGIIPAGHAGAGPVVVWDAGTFTPVDGADPVRALEEGKLSFELRGEKLKGKFTLARMQGRGAGTEWLLIKKRDGHARDGYKIETALTPARIGALRELVPPCATE